ncbi:MAG: polyribonucleotide nucleotidyltransferase [Candidatus Doudnabacteria bacterium]|nr:polyribonucleotide nucleotidyltransferase [Candidatus Doudnabacteria bacterium]
MGFFSKSDDAAAPSVAPSNVGLGVKKVSAQIGSQEIIFETGKLAKQANAAVVARQGDTVVLATAVLGRKREGMDYFPLLVDYEERLYAAGKIKGSRWVKREGRATDDAILTGRVIDRSIRPLFPDGMRNDVQVVVTVLSIDGENQPDMLSANAASAALNMSDIPFDGPISVVRVGKIDGAFVLNPTHEAMKTAQMDLIVSGTAEHVLMVEAGAQLVSEADIVGGIKFAQKYLGELCDLQNKLREAAGLEKAVVDRIEINPEILEKVKAYATEEKMTAALYVPVKDQRDNNVKDLQEETVKAITAQYISEHKDIVPGVEDAAVLLEEAQIKKEVMAALDKIMKKFMQKNILDNERRVDGRKLDETRNVTCEVGILPRTHGSALFTRGDTQVLTTLTLGSKGDEQLLDGMEDPGDGTSKRYIHHYNFPGYSVGEVAPLRGPGRREIGHGALAERAVEPMIPAQEGFPYTMRLVSEAIASDGSTSMASTCGSTLALMDGGVPIKEMIGGVAMGLVLNEETGKFKVLTDIAGIEDFNGHMDFKVTGNENGITAMQMDVKVKGITVEILEQAIAQAKPGRLHILSKMKEAISAPRADLSKYAPRIVSFKIDPDKIREVIGSGGKIINGIIAETGVKIDIEDDGLVMVTSTDAAASEKAVNWIKSIVKEIEVGEVYEGKVVRIMTFGAFVELTPGKDGMVHVSELANYRVNKVEDVVKIGDTLKVQVKEIDDQGRVNLTHRPFAAPAQPGQSDGGDRGGSGSRPSGGDRGPRRDHGDHGGRGFGR